jgi:hypothetical protein
VCGRVYVRRYMLTLSYNLVFIVVVIVATVMMLNATLNNISVISWRSVLLVEETGVPGENHRPVASHWQTLSHNVVHLALNKFPIYFPLISIYFPFILGIYSVYFFQKYVIKCFLWLITTSHFFKLFDVRASHIPRLCSVLMRLFDHLGRTTC